MNDRKLPLSIQRLVLLFAVIVVSGAPVLGQAAARPNRGAMPTGSYSVSDIENISLTNGNLSLRIALASLPPVAGGKLGLTVRAEYNSKSWDTIRTELLSDPLNQNSKYVTSNLQLSDVGGWRIGAGYSIAFDNAGSDYSWLTAPNDPEYNLLTQNVWTKVVLTTPDGAKHELRAIDKSAYADGFLLHSHLRGYYKDNPNTANGPLRYYSFDGSQLWAKIDPAQYLLNGPAPSWTLYLPDGTKIEQASGIQRIIDTNGNKIKIFTSESAGVYTEHYQDEQTGREIKSVYDPAGNSGQGLFQIQYQTVGGSWATININLGTTHVYGKRYEFGDSVCADAADDVDAQITVVRSIVYPQTEPAPAQPRRFTFAYNSDTTDAVNYQWRPDCSSAEQTVTSASHGWGSLSQIEMPTGALVNYTYRLDGEHYLAFNPDDAPREGVTLKTTMHDGTTDSWQYFNTPASGGFSGPDGSFVTETRYSSDPGFAHTNSGFGGKEELVYRTNRSNKVTVERHWTLMPFTGGENIAAGSLVLVAFNPVVDAEYTSLLDDSPSHNPVKMSAKTFQYDYNGNLIQTKEYDWVDLSQVSVSRDAQGVPTGVPAGATLLREVNNSYYNPATHAGAENVYAKRLLSSSAPLILSAIKEVSVGPSRTLFAYDGFSYGTAPTVGNLTSKSAWDDVDNRWITTSTTYDSHGNVASVTDGSGKTTQFSYADSTHALPTQVVVDPQNGTGTQTSTTVFDYATGLVTRQIDPNGNITDINYTNQLLGNVIDPFGRPGIVIGPPVNAGGFSQHYRVTTTYYDSARQVIVAADLNAENDQLLKTRTTSDMLGRPILTDQTEDGSNYTIYSRKAYDQMGRITFASSPMRYGSAATTDGWTRVTNDILGRVTEVATFSGADQPLANGYMNGTGIVSSSYNANFTTVTDQAGKVRRSQTDALGRLIRVDEPDASNNLDGSSSLKTYYEYSVLGNLTNVTQGQQTRNFAYDSLSRLRSANNPESGTVTYFYDDSGNLKVKTDARGVSTHYQYDGMNRIKRRWYNGSSSVTNVDHNVPALPSGIGASDEVTYTYDSGCAGCNTKGKLISVSSNVSTHTYGAYDAMGRVGSSTQMMGNQSYTLSYSYDLSGHLKAMTYPSGNRVNYSYDNAGRATSMAGNLCEGGPQRDYATGITYDAGNRMTKEQFGTTTPIFNKLFYNVRGQLAEIRASTSYTGPTDTNSNRGAIVNRYSNQAGCVGASCLATNNNGNLMQQDIYIPDNDTFTQFFEYDSLNRLDSVRETKNGGATYWQQAYTYDPYGNRSIRESGTTQGVGINSMQASVVQNTLTNRMYAPGETEQNHPLMNYDLAGNQTRDYFSDPKNIDYDRTYDAENRMKTSTATFSNPAGTQVSTYSYDGDGRRIKRMIGSIETWQVYGVGSELVAEYGLNAGVATLKKEYGYRNGQLLVTAEPSTGEPQSSVNVALGATVTASSTYGAQVAANAVNGDHKGLNSGWWVDDTSFGYPDWLQVDFAGQKTISEIDVYGLQQNHSSPVEPTLAMTSYYALTNFEVQYWTGSAWAAVPNGNVAGNHKVWRQFAFDPITTSKIRVYITHVAGDNHVQVVEVEAYTATQHLVPNVALAANGATVSASSAYGAQVAANAVNGDHKGLNSGWWVDDTSFGYPDWLQVDFAWQKTISEIDVYGLQQNHSSPVEPTLAMTSYYALTNFEVQYWTGSAWAAVPGGTVTGNDKVWRKFSFAPLTTSGIRVYITHVAGDNHVQVVEVEAYGPEGSGGTSKINWLVTDQLGTARMVFDETGALANMKRHDYLPFGEELTSYLGDNIRQKFTLKERDNETGLDYFGARYYGSTMGRFTSVDPVKLTPVRMQDPQRFNLYAYTRNNPLKFIDPEGKDVFLANEDKEGRRRALLSATGNLTTAEQRNIGVRKNADGKFELYVKDANKINMDKASAGYTHLTNRISNHDLKIDFTLVPKGGSAPIDLGAGSNTRIQHSELARDAGGITVSSGDGNIAVFVAEGGRPGGVLGLTASGRETPIAFPEHIVTGHELFGETQKYVRGYEGLQQNVIDDNRVVIDIENQLRRFHGLPRRSYRGHIDLGDPVEVR